MTLLAHVVLRGRHSGAEILARDLCLEHVRAGIGAAFVSLDPPDGPFLHELNLLRQEGVVVEHPKSTQVTRLGRWRFLDRTLARLRPTATFGHSVIPAAYVRTTLHPGRCVSVLHAATDDDYGPEAGPLTNLERLLRWRSTVVIAVSERAARNYRLRYGHRVPVVVIPNAIRRDAVRRSGDVRRRVRHAARIGDDDVLVLQVGRISPVKHQLRTLHALSPLLDGGGVHVWFVGGVEEVEYADALRQSAARWGHAVRMLGARSDVPDLLAAADLAVLPSESEGHSIALLEALCSGVPIVANRIPSFAPYVGAPGFDTVDTSNIVEFRRAIEEALCAGRVRYDRDGLVHDVSEASRRYYEAVIRPTS